MNLEQKYVCLKLDKIKIIRFISNILLTQQKNNKYFLKQCFKFWVNLIFIIQLT